MPSKPDSSTAKARLEEAILAKGAAREMMARHRESRFLLGKTHKCEFTIKHTRLKPVFHWRNLLRESFVL